MKKNKKSNAGRFFKIAFISLLMIFAAVSGVYCAKIYTTPHSNFVEFFRPGTLDEVKISKEKCNILILGTDNEGTRTDVMMLAQIDPERKSATVLSIPRDTRVSYEGRYRKITEVHSVGMKKGKQYGPEAAIIATKELTGIPIHHFIKMNFNAFKDCIDELGGVEFDVPQRMLYKDPYQDLDIDLQAGLQILDGDKAEQLVRFRRYKRGDLDRIEVQQNFIHALIDQKLQMKYVGKIDDIYDIVFENTQTSMTTADLIQCGMELLSIGTENIETITMPGTPQYIGEVSYVLPNSNEFSAIRETKFGYDAEGKEIIVKN